MYKNNMKRCADFGPKTSLLRVIQLYMGNVPSHLYLGDEHINLFSLTRRWWLLLFYFSLAKSFSKWLRTRRTGLSESCASKLEV